MRVENVKVYDLEESLAAARYPMIADLKGIDLTLGVEKEHSLERGIQLAHAKGGGHDQFLTGIRIAFDLTFTNKAWVEAERYRFLEFVSSQSTMHRITKFNLSEQYNEYVDKRVIEIMEEKLDDYNNLIKTIKNAPKDDKILLEELEELRKEKYLGLLYTNPAGFELTARLTTNYRCLKNIYQQRKNHRLPEWLEFCKWVETLPYAKELICVD
jgi:hypothetical protein